MADVVIRARLDFIAVIHEEIQERYGNEFFVVKGPLSGISSPRGKTPYSVLPHCATQPGSAAVCLQTLS